MNRSITRLLGSDRDRLQCYYALVTRRSPWRVPARQLNTSSRGVEGSAL